MASQFFIATHELAETLHDTAALLEFKTETHHKDIFCHKALLLDNDKACTVWELRSAVAKSVLTSYLDTLDFVKSSEVSSLNLEPHFQEGDLVESHSSHQHDPEKLMTRREVEDAISAAIDPLSTTVRLLARHLDELEADFETKADATDLEGVTKVLDVDLDDVRAHVDPLLQAPLRSASQQSSTFGSYETPEHSPVTETQDIPDVPSDVPGLSLEDERARLREEIATVSGKDKRQQFKKLFHRSILTLQHAVHFDHASCYIDACEWYDIGTQYLTACWKLSDNVDVRTRIRHQLMKYLDRMDLIQNFLDDVATANKVNELRDAMEAHNVVETPTVSLDSLAGLEEAKGIVQEITNAGPKQRPKSVLLYGPAGSGKQLLARAIGSELKAQAFISLSQAAAMMSDEGIPKEKLVAEIIKVAQERTPCIVFVRNIETVESNETDTIEAEFLRELAKHPESRDGILVVGSTRRPWKLNHRMKDRFEQLVYVPAPDAKALKALYQKSLSEIRHVISEEELDTIANQFAGKLTGRDVTAVMQDVVYLPIKKLQSATHFKPVVTDNSQSEEDDVQKYTPSEPTHADAKPGSWHDFDHQVLVEPPVEVTDVTERTENHKSEFSEEDLERLLNWKKLLDTES